MPVQGGHFAAGVTIPPPTGTRELFQSQLVPYHSSGSIDSYIIGVSLANPYTVRQTTLANVTSLLAAVGVVALGLAMIVATAVAHRFTTPLRRLTEASRSIAEGDFTERIDPADVRVGSSELTELAVQFNSMAEQLEESVSIIRRDRDRSRDFLADVSHELRTPIAALLTFNELLKDQAAADPAARAEFLDSSRVQLERLDWLAQNLLELSKLESGSSCSTCGPTTCALPSSRPCEQAQPAARREAPRAAPVDARRPTPDPPRPAADRPGREQPGRQRDQVHAAGRPDRRQRRPQPATAPGSTWPTRASASTPRELPRIFERFYRGSGANEARGTGSGLGLAIVRSIVDMHHGTIAVDSQLGVGAGSPCCCRATRERRGAAPPGPPQSAPPRASDRARPPARRRPAVRERARRWRILHRPGRPA